MRTRTVSQRAGSRSLASAAVAAPWRAGVGRGRRARVPEAVGVLAAAHVGLGGAHARVLLAEADRGDAVERVEHVGVEARLADLLPEGRAPCDRGSDRAAGSAWRAARRRAAPRARSCASATTANARSAMPGHEVARRSRRRIGAHAAPGPAAVGLAVGEQEAEPALDARVGVVAGPAERRERPAVEVQRDGSGARLRRLAEREIADAAVGACDESSSSAARGDRARAPCRGRSRPCARARAGSHRAGELGRTQRLLRRLGGKRAVLLLLAQERLDLGVGERPRRPRGASSSSIRSRRTRATSAGLPSRSRIGTGSRPRRARQPDGKRGGAPGGGAGVRRFIIVEGYRKNQTCERARAKFFQEISDARAERAVPATPNAAGTCRCNAGRFQVRL